MWHRVAPVLTTDHTVVAADLRGYGDSGKPAGGTDHAGYGKRAMAADQVGLMRALGFDSFAVVGHDRGARVAQRMCLDCPEQIDRIAVLDIVPTRHMFATRGPDLRPRLLPLVLPLAARRSARTPHRFRSGVLPATQAGSVVSRHRGVRARGGCRVRPLFLRSRRDPRQLRRLPGRRDDRPQARRHRRGVRAPCPMPAAGNVGQPRLRRATLRRRGGLA
ncbi:MAG: alpha/beta fold hydrolase [Sciscionella sp.]